jgi:hypothetical protein
MKNPFQRWWGRVIYTSSRASVQSPSLLGDGSRGMRWDTNECSRERHRERGGASRHLFPALTGWAKLCRAYGAGNRALVYVAASSFADGWRMCGLPASTYPTWEITEVDWIIALDHR